MAILEVKDLEVYYGVIQAIRGISFEVKQGEIIALIGANGAGKTTTLQTITGLIPSPERFFMKARILPKFRDTSWYLWGLLMCRRDAGYLHHFPFCRI